MSEGTPEDAGATGGAGCVSSGSWWGGLLQAAKEKSASALEVVKQDISEFTSVMHCDTESFAHNMKSKLTQENATAAAINVKHGMTSLLGGISRALIIPYDDEADDEAITVSSTQHIFDRSKARLHAIQIDQGTYCDEPTGSPSEYEKWCSTFDLDSKKGDISELLVANVEVRAVYTKMVPSSVSHADFWRRYFYKVYQLEQDEARRAELMKRADVVHEKEELAWDEEDDWESPEVPESSDQKEPDTPALVDDSKPTKSSKEGADTTTSLSHSIPAEAPEAEEQKPDTISSPTDTVSTESPVDSTSQQLPQDLSAETLTVVTAGSPSEESSGEVPDTTDGPASQPQAPAKAAVPEAAEAVDLPTKLKGDLVVVGDGQSSSPSASESNSHNKESLDEDWEKDFDIEVTEDDIRQAQDAAKDLPVEPQEGDEDWESWE